MAQILQGRRGIDSEVRVWYNGVVGGQRKEVEVLCPKCEGSLRAVRSKFSGKREVWSCKTPGCPGKEEIKLMGPVVEVGGNEEGEVEVNTDEDREFETIEVEDEATVDFITRLDEEERREEMAKKGGLASVVNETKEEKKARLKAAKEAKKAERAKEAEAMVKGRATKTKGKKAAVKAEKVKAEPKDCPLCPCCGERTGNPKSYFLMGHDGRVKGWFTKKAKGKLPEEVELTDELEKMYKLWKKDPDMKIKDIVKKVRGIKD